MSWYEQLAFPEPRCEAAVELARLLDSRAELESKLDALDREQRAAGEEVARLSAELVALERRGLEGEEVSPAARTKAEEALAKAQAAHAAPWGERRQALKESINGHQGRVQRFVGEHFGELVEEVEQDGALAAEAIDDAAAKLVEAARERDQASKRLDALNATVRGASRFGDVAISRADAVAREAGRMLAEGGEVAPRVRDELRPPQDLAEDDSQVAEATPV
jgi:chromosome segregation ATPase